MNVTETMTKNVWTLPVLGGVLFTSLSYIVAVYLGWTTIENVSLLEALAVFTSYVCTIQCVFQTRWNYPVGIVTTFLYSWLFFTFEMYAVALFNLYLVFSLVYGWFRWGDDAVTKPVSFVKDKWWLGYAALGFGVLLLLLLINEVFGVSITWIEIAITVASAVAQFLLDNKKIETWIVWAVVNVASIAFYYSGGLYIVTFQYVFFLLNTIYGYYMWNKSMQKDEVYGNA